MTMLLEVEGLAAGYGRVDVVRGVGLAVGEGETVALLGANGAGKSTTLRSIAGVLPPSAGVVRFAGESIVGVRAHAIARRGLAFVPDSRDLFGDMSVIDNLRLGTRALGGRGNGAGALDGVFELFPVLAERRRQRARSLSGGEQQMLAIGRALMAEPRVLMLDEPSTGLSPKLTHQMLQAVARIAETGVAILLVEQSARIVSDVCDRGYVIRSGEIVLAAEATQLFEEDTLRQAYFADGTRPKTLSVATPILERTPSVERKD